MRKRSVGVLVATGVLVIAASASSAEAAPATTASSVASEVSRPLAHVFPDVAGLRCRGGAGGTHTSTGARPIEAYSCDFSETAPGARVVLAQWPDVASAQRWYQDTADRGPRLEPSTTWSTGRSEQGPLHTASNGRIVYSTGLYADSAFGWQIQAASLDEVGAIAPQLTLLPFTTYGF